MSSSARADGRTPGMMRSLTLERSFLSRADGSARWEQDRSVVLAAVYGPRAVSSRKEDPERMTIEVECRPASGMQTASERALEYAVRRSLSSVLILEKHPRLGLLVVLQVVSSDGSLEACCVNAASAAVLDAAVPCRGVLCAAACATIDASDKNGDASSKNNNDTSAVLVADPTAEEEKSSLTLTTASFSFKGGLPLESSSDGLAGDRTGDGDSGRTDGLPLGGAPDSEPVVTHTSARGAFQSEEAYYSATSLARDASLNVFAFLRKQFHETNNSGGRIADATPVSIEKRTEALRLSRTQNPGSGGYRKTFAPMSDAMQR